MKLMEYLLAPTDNLIRFWGLKVKVTAGRQGQILWTAYRVNYLSNLNETYRGLTASSNWWSG